MQRPQPPGLTLVPKELVGIQLLMTIPPQFHTDYTTKIKLHDIVRPVPNAAPFMRRTSVEFGLAYEWSGVWNGPKMG